MATPASSLPLARLACGVATSIRRTGLRPPPARSPSRPVCRALLLAAALGGAGGLVGCKDLTSVPGLPAGTPNPVFYNSKAGALGLRNAAVLQFEQALSQYVTAAGLLTDELEDLDMGASAGLLSLHQGLANPLDERILPEEGQFDANAGTGVLTGGVTYTTLTTARAQANLALGALAAYDTAPADADSARVLRSELYALEGYAEIYLADLYCSGVPLSTLDYQHDYTYGPSATTHQVYLDAIAKFDSALSLATGHDSVANLARVGKGRAELAVNNYQAAADDVALVAPGFVYTVYLGPPGLGVPHVTPTAGAFTVFGMVADSEGVTGLPFVSSHDPRVLLDTFPRSQILTALGHPFQTVYGPRKYQQLGTAYPPFTLASGVEAQLIQAEAQLQPAASPSGPWLATLNQLRRGIALSDTTDPGASLSGVPAATARINLLFRERAFWLFLDGHRQGDLRRLIRQYQLPQNQVYPTSTYRAPGLGIYGTDVTAPIPSSELTNPLFHGCLDRNA